MKMQTIEPGTEIWYFPNKFFIETTIDNIPELKHDWVEWSETKTCYHNSWETHYELKNEKLYYLTDSDYIYTNETEAIRGYNDFINRLIETKTQDINELTEFINELKRHLIKERAL